MRTKLVPLLTGALCLLALAGCATATGGTATSGSSASSDALRIPTATAGQGAAQVLTITAKDNFFEPKQYAVEAGKPIRLTFSNDGQNVHEFEVKGLVPETKIASKASKTIDVPAQQPGTFKIYCEIHEDSGMEGELVVR